jgi:estrogen-related receptor beta like 1
VLISVIVCFERNRKPPLPPLGPLGFAVQKSPSEQFPYFSAVCAWLFEEMRCAQYIVHEEYEDPTSISKKILQTVDELGMKHDINPSKLRHGYGDSVILILNFLCDQALEYQNFIPKHPRYQQSGDASAEAMDAMEADQDDMIEENFGDEDVDNVEDDSYNFYGGGVDVKQENKTTLEVQEATVDPAEWKLELERVGPMLKWRATHNALEWRTHLEQSKKHEKLLQTHFPDAKVSLLKIHKQLTANLERISTKEAQINREFDQLGGNFKENQQKADKWQGRYNELTKTKADLTKEFDQIIEEAEEIKQQLAQKTSNMTDRAPLVGVTEGLGALKEEIQKMELRVGVVGQSLLQLKMKAASDAAVAKAKPNTRYSTRRSSLDRSPRM